MEIFRSFEAVWKWAARSGASRECNLAISLMTQNERAQSADEVVRQYTAIADPEQRHRYEYRY